MNSETKEFKIDISKIEKALLEKENRIKKYFEIMEKFNIDNFKEDVFFRKIYNDFYKIRQRPQEFYDSLYYYLEQNKNENAKYEDVLNYFYSKFGSVEKSFSSKILATINPNMPVWDTEVLKKLGMTAPAYKSKDRLLKTIKMYYEIVGWYEKYLKTANAKEALTRFDKIFPNKEVTNIKKIDLILWSIRD